MATTAPKAIGTDRGMLIHRRTERVARTHPGRHPRVSPKVIALRCVGGLIAGLWMLVPHALFAQALENVRIQLVSGSSLRATIDRVDPEGALTGRDLPADLRWEQISRIEVADVEPAGEPLEVELAGGGRLLVASVMLDGETLQLQSGLGVESLPLEVLRGLVWQRSERVDQLLSARPTDNDLILVETDNGLREVPGILEAIDATHVQLNYDGESRKIARERVAAIVTADLGIATPRGAITRLTTRQGSIIVGRLAQFEEGRFRILLAGDQPVEIAAGQVAAVAIESDALAWLSDLTPLEVDEQSVLAYPRGWQANRSVEGNPLRLRFRDGDRRAEFEKGIGVKAYSRLVFENVQDFNRFRATVGIDAETRGRGDCVMSVRGDGIRLWSQRVRAADDPLPISIDISGIRQVELVVEPGVEFDLADHADWCNARFLKTDDGDLP